MEFQSKRKKYMKTFDGDMFGSCYGSQTLYDLMGYGMYGVRSLNPPMLTGICNP